MKKYKALMDLPFDIKKDDILIWHKNKKGVCLNSEGNEIPFDVVKEKTFFKEIVEIVGEYAIGTNVLLTKQVNCRLYKDGANSTKTFELPAWTEFKVVAYIERYKKVTPIVEFNKIKYELNTTLVLEATPYFYINSSGKVCKTYLNRDLKSDDFRLKSKNMFNTNQSAKMVLVNILMS